MSYKIGDIVYSISIGQVPWISPKIKKWRVEGTECYERFFQCREQFGTRADSFWGGDIYPTFAKAKKSLAHTIKRQSKEALQLTKELKDV